MKKSMDELYREAKRFDEGTIYQSRAYGEICKRQFRLYDEMCALFGPQLSRLLEEYAMAVSDECDFECRHFFEQGYLLGRGPKE